eukprot:12481-Eustigmatos_ZCMA.PRE.1
MTAPASIPKVIVPDVLEEPCGLLADCGLGEHIRCEFGCMAECNGAEQEVIGGGSDYCGVAKPKRV